jgi:tetratricopeptide (TPR) repeat protein
MDSAQEPIFTHWLSKISHLWPLGNAPLKQNAIIQPPSKEMQFSRIALFSGSPFLWMDAPGEYEHNVSVHKLLKWCMQLPGVHLGLNPTGIGLIVRSIFTKRQKTLSVSEERVLNRVGAYQDEEFSWEADDDRFGPYVDQLFQYINQEEPFEGYVWVDPKEVKWWSEATFDSLIDYQENSRSGIQYRRLLNRHRCMLFAPFDIDAFSNHLQKLPEINATKYQPLFSKINDTYNEIGLSAPLIAYWSWELLHFDRVAGKHFCKPLLALWSDWPYSTLWAPPRPVAYETTSSFSSNKAASFLEELLWEEIETIFGEVSLDCGLPWGAAVTSFAERKIYSPLFYFADPSTPPENPDDYVSRRKLDIQPLVKTCLGSEDLSSDRLAWGILEGSLVAMRQERNEDSFVPLYLLLPLNSESVTSVMLDKKVDEDLAVIIDDLTSEECFIAVQAAEVDKEENDISERAALWSGTLDDGNNAIEEAITLLPQLGLFDRKRMSNVLMSLYVPLRRLQAVIEQTHAEVDKLRRLFYDSVDSTEDTLRQMALSSLPHPGVRNLRDAMLDSYPYHYLQQPIQDLHSHMDLLLRRSERINTSLNTVLTEMARDTSEHQVQWTPRLALLFTFLALLIGLPTLIPQAVLRPDTYPSWLERYLPLANVEAGARDLAMVVALATLITLILYFLAWLRQYSSGHQDDVQRFSSLVKQAENTTRSNSDRSKLERLDEKAIRVLATIWDQRKQEAYKRKTFHWLQWPFRSMQATDWLRKVRFNRDIINLSVLLPETIKTILLPRTLCILRYKMSISGEPLISDQYFLNSFRKIGLKDDDIIRLENGLTDKKNVRRIQQLKVRTFATILKERGVTSALEQRIAAKWDDPLDAEQKHFDSGELLYEQGKYEEAITAFQEALKLNKKDSYYDNALGIAYSAQGNHEEAINAYRKAIQLAPDDPYPHNNLAMVYARIGNRAEAKQEFQHRIKMSPDDALVANVSLGVLLIHEGQNEVGFAHLRRAIEIYQEQANKQSIMTDPDYRASYLMARIGLGEEQVVSKFQEAVQSKQIPLDSLKDDLVFAKLLASAPKPPPGIEQVVTTLKVRCS